MASLIWVSMNANTLACWCWTNLANRASKSFRLIFAAPKSFYMFCHWVGAECLEKLIFVQLESGDCSDFSFCADYCCLANCLEKKWFLVGKIIFWWNWTSGDCWICPFLCLLLPGRLPATLQFHKNDFPYPKITSFRAVCLCLSLLLWCLPMFGPSAVLVCPPTGCWSEKQDEYKLSKRLVVLAYIGGLSFLFLPYRFGGGGTWWHGTSTC